MIRQHAGELQVVGGGEHHGVPPHQVFQNPPSRETPLLGVGTPVALVKAAPSRQPVTSGLEAPQHTQGLLQVIALPFDDIIRPADGSKQAQGAAAVLPGQAGGDGLGHMLIHPIRPQLGVFTRHVGPGNQDAAATDLEGGGHRLRQKRMIGLL